MERAILHIDGDSFFASCEIALNPVLRGRPVVTGMERGIASSMTYEAKRLGVKRGMRISEIRKISPDIVILSSHYEIYGLFSKRMFEIVRRYTPLVEEYSIDECFADLTGYHTPAGLSYENLIKKIKDEIEAALGFTVSVGLGPNKVIAKVASKWKKPSGCTMITKEKIQDFLRDVPIGKVWGIGHRTVGRFLAYNIQTALDFAEMNGGYIHDQLSKPFHELWLELNGHFAFPLNLEPEPQKSIQKTRTFTPPSSDRRFILSQLSKNAEGACTKARREGLATRHIFFYLKTQDFKYKTTEITLDHPTSAPHEIIEAIERRFDTIYVPGTLYRTTGVYLVGLHSDKEVQYDFFGSVDHTEKWRQVLKAVDSIDHKFGSHSVHLGSSHRAYKYSDEVAAREGLARKVKLGIPLLGDVS